MSKVSGKFTYDNGTRMGIEYHSIMGKPMAPCDHPCNNLGEPNTFPVQQSGTPALNYIIPGDVQLSSVGYDYQPKYGKPGKYYNTGDYYKDDE